MRSLALIAAPVGPCSTLRNATQSLAPAPTAVARSLHFLSAMARPPRLPPMPAGTLVTKKLIIELALPPPAPSAPPPGLASAAPSLGAPPSALAPPSILPPPPPSSLPPVPPLPPVPVPPL